MADPLVGGKVVKVIVEYESKASSAAFDLFLQPCLSATTNKVRVHGSITTLTLILIDSVTSEPSNERIEGLHVGR